MSESYDVSIGITTHMGVKDTGWIAQNSDSLGARSIWIGEDIALGQETFVLTAATLLQSKKVRVGTGIIPVTVHNISTLARAGVTLDEMGAGRFAFGLGIGGTQDLEKHGIHIKKPGIVPVEGRPEPCIDSRYPVGVWLMQIFSEQGKVHPLTKGPVPPQLKKPGM